jgi:hypothetical protein
MAAGGRLPTCKNRFKKWILLASGGGRVVCPWGSCPVEIRRRLESDGLQKIWFLDRTLLWGCLTCSLH